MCVCVGVYVCVHVCECVSVCLCLQAWYLGYGAKDVLEQSCRALESKIEVLVYLYTATHTTTSTCTTTSLSSPACCPTSCQVWLDGRLVELPALEGVVVLNINSWSAGCTMWREGDGAGLAASRCGRGWVGEAWEWSSDCASSLSL